MLPKKHRLVKACDFNIIKKKGRRYNANYYGLIVYERGDTNPSRFAFIVSKKISPKAVNRNKIKRFLRSLVSDLVKKVKPGYDVLFLSKKNIVKAEPSELKNKTRDLFDKAQII
jgi:ribonuclease P protein component